MSDDGITTQPGDVNEDFLAYLSSIKAERKVYLPMITCSRRSTDKELGVNKSDVVQALQLDGIPQPDQAVNRVFDAIGAALACGEPVSIRNFGKFEPRKRSEVVRKNPKTGAEIHVPEKLSVGFVPAPALKQRINRMVTVSFNGSGR